MALSLVSVISAPLLTPETKPPATFCFVASPVSGFVPWKRS